MADPRASAGPRSAEIEALEASIRAISEGDEAASATAASAGPDDAPHAGTGGDYSHSPGRRGPVDGPAAASARGSPAPEGAKRLLSREELFEIFDFYCNYGRSMVQDYQESLDSFMFMKFARECPQLLSGSVNRTAIDLIFAKAKPKFERRLDFDHFLDALSAIAEKKFPDYPPRDGLRLLLAQHLVPHHELVRHEMLKTGETEVPLTGIYKRLYDPRSYTGVYAERFRTGDGRINGDTEARSGRSFRGSTNTGTNETVHDISSLMRPHLHGGGTMMSPVNHSSFRVKKRRDLAAAGAGAAAASSGRSKSPGASLRGRSRSRAGSMRSASSGRMGGRSRSAGRLSRGASGAAGTRSSAAAAAAAADRANKAAIAEMERALSAAREGKHEEAAEASLRAQALTETARAARAAAEAAAAGDGDEDALSAYGEYVDDEEDLEDPVPEPTDEFLAELRGTAPPLDQTAIKEIFLFYSNFGRSRAQDYQESLDSFMFMKFARECPHLLDGRVLNRTSVDLIFTKAKAKGERRLSFSHFLDALSAMAEKKYEMFSAPDALRLLISRNLAPHYALVLEQQAKTGETEVPLTGIYKRLYDPRSYTGVYAERFRSGDGRINGDTDARAGRSFRGSTNTGTDETIHDISSLMRPNLRSGTMMRSRAKSFGGSPRRRPQSARAAAGPSDRLLAPTASTQAKAVDGDGTPRSRGWH
ncbi:hypothetical protein FNF28_02589 [Cafeteria roenbergensis]|uniref:Uncharacterized protein n=1 Tax=Cafeteria roenbergensis TaxID=33653 RepID=A0A5A8DWC9_CAFRO|nr:hypothetical protein FNF28_02589 [Cafeteria roenbergensis]